jgi:hypothetical protein
MFRNICLCAVCRAASAQPRLSPVQENKDDNKTQIEKVDCGNVSDPDDFVPGSGSDFSNRLGLDSDPSLQYIKFVQTFSNRMFGSKVAFKYYLWKKVNTHVFISIHSTFKHKKLKICQFQ